MTMDRRIHQIIEGGLRQYHHNSNNQLLGIEFHLGKIWQEEVEEDSENLKQNSMNKYNL